MPSKPRVIYWFRTDLRLHDSPALKAALDLKPECLYPVWCWDPHYVYRARVGPNRFQFLIDCQNDLSSSITKLNKKSKLFVVREAPQTVLVKLFKAWKISHLVFEKDTDAYARGRDEDVIKQAKAAGVEVIVKMGRTLYDPDDLVKHNGGKPTMSMSQVQHAAEKLGDPAKPVPAPKSIPDPGDTNISFSATKPHPTPDFNQDWRNSSNKSYDELAGPKGDFSPPTLAELGMKATTQHRGGETIARKMLDDIIANKEYTATFAKPNTAPTAFDPQSTTLLSPHHHFGSLSVREFYWRIQDVLKSYPKAKQSTIPTNLIGQLLFRDMYFGAQAEIGGAFAQTVGNSHCRFVPWHLPSTVSPKAPHLITGDYEIDSPEAEVWFQRWKYGRTGFPWIDAVMRQLRQEGWIHHLARHAVACFLTRGGCYIHWERGADVFAEWLLDHEVACNSGNWQWLSCTAFFAQFYRCYSPIAFPKKTDPDGAYVRHFVPELKDYPAKYIYEPWRCPIADQKAAGCVIKADEVGTDAKTASDNKSSSKSGEMQTYPKPMFDFNERREICIQGLKNAYSVGLYGNDPKVLDGSWRGEFGDKAEGPTQGKNDKSAPKLFGTKGPHHGGDEADRVEQGGKKGVAGQKRARPAAADDDVDYDDDEGEEEHEEHEPKKTTSSGNSAKGKKQTSGTTKTKGKGPLDKHFSSPERKKGRN